LTVSQTGPNMHILLGTASGQVGGGNLI